MRSVPTQEAQRCHKLTAGFMMLSGVRHLSSPPEAVLSLLLFYFILIFDKVLRLSRLALQNPLALVSQALELQM